MTEQETWFAGEAEELEADYAHVVRRWTRVPEKRPWGDVDYGESEAVAVCHSAEERDRIIADHNAAALLDKAKDALENGVEVAAFLNDNGSGLDSPLLLRWEQNARALIAEIEEATKEQRHE